ARGGEDLQNPKLSGCEIDAVGEGASSIDRYAQAIVLLSQTTSSVGYMAACGNVGCATNLSLATKPFPLDGCPMFADFRVHGLNTTFFQCFHHRSTPTCRK